MKGEATACQKFQVLTWCDCGFETAVVRAVYKPLPPLLSPSPHHTLPIAYRLPTFSSFSMAPTTLEVFPEFARLFQQLEFLFRPNAEVPRDPNEFDAMADALGEALELLACPRIFYGSAFLANT